MRKPFYAPAEDAPNERAYTREETEQMIEERLAAQRSQYEQSLAAQQRACEEARQQLHAHEMRERAQSLLQEKGLPQSLIGALRLEDENALRKSLSCAEGAFRTALEEGVRARLRAGAIENIPQEAGKGTAARLSYRQAAEMYTLDPAAYQKQFGGK